MRKLVLGAGPLLWIALSAAHAEWRDPSPHKVTMVDVETDVRLEVLDWGGSGRPVILLAGGGNTAHVYDDFALKLRASGHRVYGLTRRGYGASSVPNTGYTADRLGEDVASVINTLKLERPVLVGHSFAGQELSSMGARHPDRIAGLVYLDAVHCYDAAFEAEGLYLIPEWKQQLKDLQSQLHRLEEEPFDSRPLARELLEENLPQIRTVLETLVRIENGRPPRPSPGPADLESFSALQAWYARGAKVVLPEAEFRQMQVATPDGRPTMTFRAPPRVGQATQAGRQKFTNIQTPALGIVAMMNDPGDVRLEDSEARANSEAYVWFQNRRAERRVTHFKADLPNARVVLLQHADHYVFLSHETDVLREIGSFMRSLK